MYKRTKEALGICTAFSSDNISGTLCVDKYVDCVTYMLPFSNPNITGNYWEFISSIVQYDIFILRMLMLLNMSYLL